MTDDFKKRKCYFLFSGYCITAFAAETLGRYRIPCRIVKAPLSMRRSCSFALLTSYDDMDRAMSVLEKENIVIAGREIN